jgi:hypothetical protein
MFGKKTLVLAFAIQLSASVAAQTNADDKGQASAPKPSSAPGQLVPSASAPVVKSAEVTIAELAAKQASALAASANKEVSASGPVVTPIGQGQPRPVPELKPDQAIAITTDKDVKPFLPVKPPPPPKPYLAAVIGLKGKEIAEVQTSPVSSITITAGDTIKGWTVESIAGSKLYLAKTEVVKQKKKAKTVNRQFVWAVGEYLN